MRRDFPEEGIREVAVLGLAVFRCRGTCLGAESICWEEPFEIRFAISPYILL
jgi:hypothetical protein